MNSIRRISWLNKRSLDKPLFFQARSISTTNKKRKGVILGIETSCDDTGCAVIDTDGNLLGEALVSQQTIHSNNGGIIPPIAQYLHRKHIDGVVNKAVRKAGITFKDLSAVAAAVMPGLPLSLMIGMKYGKHLCRTYQKPFIPIHHMEAHALTARMIHKDLEYPFLTLLISGGHCLLGIVQEVDSFLLLGESLDDAPGEAFDKLARRMKLKNLPECSTLSGGQAIELMASRADDPLQFKLTEPLLQLKNCMFSMAGLKTQVLKALIEEERAYNVSADEVIPTVSNLCAAFQYTLTKHLCRRLQRAIGFARLRKFLPTNKQTLVVSGGAACNDFIAKGLGIVCKETDFRLVRPPPKLCTDNGIMIAWNGVERWRKQAGIYEDFDAIQVKKNAPLGRSLIKDVEKANVSGSWVKLNELLETNEPKKAVTY